MTFTDPDDTDEPSGIRPRVALCAPSPPSALRWTVDPVGVRFPAREAADAFIRATGRTDLRARET